MTYQLVNILILIAIGHTGADNCQSLQVSNTVYQASLEGRYEMIATQCYGRQAYEQQDGTNYIYYWDESAFTGWVIGTTLCGNTVGMRGKGTAASPDGVDTWEETYFGIWFVMSAAVKCIDPSTTIRTTTTTVAVWTEDKIAGIVAGVVCSIILAIGMIVLGCFIKSKNKIQEMRTSPSTAAGKPPSEPAVYYTEPAAHAPPPTEAATAAGIPPPGPGVSPIADAFPSNIAYMVPIEHPSRKLIKNKNLESNAETKILAGGLHLGD